MAAGVYKNVYKTNLRHQIGKIITQERNDPDLSREEVAEALDTPMVILGLIEDRI